jgi:retron-type reverse transcriptase
MNIINKRIKDPRFLELIRKALKAGYMEGTIYSSSLVGTPQGSIISPILLNIYMDHFDKYIEKLASEFNIGPSASRNPI